MNDQTNPVKSSQNEFNRVNPNKNFLIIVIAIAIIAVGAGGFILGKYSDNIPAKVAELEEEKNEVAEKETGKCASIQNISEKNQCWTELAKEEKDENYCKKISANFPEARGDCYTELAILKDDSLICEKINSSSLHKSCLEYFEENNEKDETADWESYQNAEFGYEIKYQPSFKIDTSDQMKKITIGSPAVPYYTILIEKSISSLKELKSLMQEQIEHLAPPNLKTTWKDTIVADKKAIEISYESFAGGTAIIYKTGVIKDTTAYIISSSSYTNNETEYYQIISTFKFINPVADYFENAELQCETEIQNQEIFTALNDVLNLSEEQLKQRRYKDYTGKGNQWDLPTLIYRHFIPEYPGVTLGNNFYHDVKSMEAQKQIKQILEKYFQSNPFHF